MVDTIDLVNHCRLGDDLAWEALVKRFQPRIYALAYTYVRDREEARDLTQEIFVRVFKGLSRFHDDGAFTAWILALGRNCCIDRLRKAKRTPSDGEPLEPDEHQSHFPDPQRQLEATRRNQLLYQAISEVSPASREMIMLKDIQGLKLREIATILTLPLGTVKSRTNRARVELAQAVLKLDPSYGT